MNKTNFFALQSRKLWLAALILLVSLILPESVLADYASNCSTCHGPLASSTKKGRTAAQIQAAININTGGMGSLSTLTPAQVDAISVELGSPSTCVSPNVWDTTGTVCGTPPPCTYKCRFSHPPLITAQTAKDAPLISGKLGHASGRPGLTGSS